MNELDNFTEVLNIKEIVKDQRKLILPICKNGTTDNIRKFAIEESSKLAIILDSRSSLEDFIKEYKQSLIMCCMSMYNTLNDDSRTLPTYKLKELARAEADRIMKIWENIEKFQ